MRVYSAVGVVILSLSFGNPALGEDAASFRWRQTASMTQPRLGHSMVELPAGPNALGLGTGAGKVMVIGGFDSHPFAAPSVPANPLASCEIYDPDTDTWTAAAPHPVAASWRWAATLRNGMILVAGGAKDLFTAQAESHLYDPKTDRWIATKKLPTGVVNPHAFMRAVTLPTGQILIAGGEDDRAVQIARRTGVLPHSQNAFVFTLNEQRPELSFWDYTRDSSTGKVSSMPEPRTTSALILMSNGSVLNAGGLGPAFNGQTGAATNTASTFDPATGRWVKVEPMPAVYGPGEDELITSYTTAPGSRWAPYSEGLGDGRALIAGGVGGLFEVLRASAVVFDAHSGHWEVAAPMHYFRSFGSWEGVVGDRDAILFAGAGFTSSDGATRHDLTGELYNPETGKWSLVQATGGPSTDGPTDNFESRSVRLSNGALQVAGGADLATATLGTTESWIFGPR